MVRGCAHSARLYSASPLARGTALGARNSKNGSVWNARADTAAASCSSPRVSGAAVIVKSDAGTGES